MSFSFVESYIKSHKASSGGKPISRGFMYFLESFVHDLNGELNHFRHELNHFRQTNEQFVCFTKSPEGGDDEN